jgi:hypothetical protein
MTMNEKKTDTFKSLRKKRNNTNSKRVGSFIQRQKQETHKLGLVFKDENEHHVLKKS